MMTYVLIYFIANLFATTYVAIEDDWFYTDSKSENIKHFILGLLFAWPVLIIQFLRK